jgi:hypothetical protein
LQVGLRLPQRGTRLEADKRLFRALVLYQSSTGNSDLDG